MTAPSDFAAVAYHADGPVCTITLNRPEKLNAFNGDLFRDVSRAAETATADPTVAVVVFTGAGRAFSSGADLTDITSTQAREEWDPLEDRIRAAQSVFDRVAEIPKPTIAAINGHAVGAGLQLALACDFRLVARGARLGLSDVKIGIIPALGATTRLPELVGVGQAKELLLTGDLIEADRALEIGLVHRVVEGGSLEAEVGELAEKLAARAPLALAAAKELLDTRAPLDRVAAAQARLIRSEDAREGIRAFLEKRSPRFTGS